ncbi:hypothetical protein LJR234_000080 [Mesorhizobium amorphae]
MDALAGVDLGLPVERQMITELGDDDLGDQRLGRQEAGHDMLGRMRCTTALEQQRQRISGGA